MYPLPVFRICVLVFNSEAVCMLPHSPRPNCSVDLCLCACVCACF